MTTPSSKKKSRGSRVALTHFEVRRKRSLLLRLAVSDDAVDEVRDELGALMKKIAPCAAKPVVAAPVERDQTDEFLVTPTHEGDVVRYHEDLRERLAELFGSLCDTGLDEALEIARLEVARRAEGAN